MVGSWQEAHRPLSGSVRGGAIDSAAINVSGMSIEALDSAIALEGAFDEEGSALKGESAERVGDGSASEEEREGGGMGEERRKVVR
jgi:hypothetical protein